MNIALWALQIVLAAVFLGAGLMKSTQPLVRLESKVGAWDHDVPLPQSRVTGPRSRRPDPAAGTPHRARTRWVRGSRTCDHHGRSGRRPRAPG